MAVFIPIQLQKMAKKILLKNTFYALFFLTTTVILVPNITIAQAPIIHSFSPDAAGQYSWVQISGIHLNNATNVTFGNISANTFQVESDTIIWAQVGSGASGAVAVQNIFGTGSLPGFTFSPPPLIYSFSPTSAHWGDTVIIKGIHFSGVNLVGFGYDEALSFTVPSDSIIKAVVGNGSSGEVYVENTFGYDTMPGFIYTGPSITNYFPKGGVIGTTVNIKGQHFLGISQVRIANTAAASFTIVSDTVIKATSATAASGNIVIESIRGNAIAEGFNVPAINNVNPNAGTIGDTINIYGINLLHTQHVYFGDSAAASFTILADTLLRAVVGNGSTGAIKVITTADSALSNYFYYFPYTPYITSFSPTIAGTGDTITIKGIHLKYISRVNFGGVDATSFSILGDSIVKAVVGNGATGDVWMENIFNNTSSNSGFIYEVKRTTINTILPTTGSIGSTVTIRGRNFNSIASQNVIRFGNIKATEITGNDTILVVKVPPGAVCSQICVTNNWYADCSAETFIVTFTGAMYGFNNLSIDTAIKIPTNTDLPVDIAAADFDNDGKTDVVVAGGYFGNITNIVSIYRNVSNSRYIQFAPAQNITVGIQGYSGYKVTTADMNADGKTDLVVLNSGENLASIFLNTSVGNNIQFAPKIDVVTGSPNGPEGTNPTKLAIGDFDRDGLPDMAWANFGLDNWCKITYAKNTGANGSVSFGTGQNYPVVDADGVYAADLNNDRKADLAVSIYVNGSFMKQINTFKNISQLGTVDFQQNNSIGAENSLRTSDIAFADLDKDGKTDMVSINGNYNSISIFKNISSNNGNVEFTDPPQIITINSGYRLNTIAITDADGDGKLDMAITEINVSGTDSLYLYKNISTPGNILFATRVAYIGLKNPEKIIAADFNNDGRPDFAVISQADTSIKIYTNRIGLPVRLCANTGSTTLQSNITGTTYQWQISVNGGSTFTNISNNSNYTGTNTQNLTVANVPSSFTGNTYRCLIGTSSYSQSYSIQFQNTFIGTINNQWHVAGNWSCGVVPDANTDVVIKTGQVLVNNNASCYSLTVLPGASVQVATGFMLTVTH